MSRPGRKTFKPSPQHEISVYPVLVALVGGLVAFGLMSYSLLLAVLSAGFVGFFSWLWWWRQRQKPAGAAHRTPARPRPARKTAKQRRR